MRVNGGRCDVDVAEQNLDHPDVDAILKEARRIAVPKRARSDPLCDACCAGGRTAGAFQHMLAGWFAARFTWKEPAAVPVGQPKAAQIIQNRLRQRRQPLLVAFANDAEQQTGTVYRCDLKGRSLGDAQAAGIDEGETAPVNRVLYAAEECANLGVRQNIGQAPLLGRANSFFENRGQERSSVREKRN
jgi:hypothetical protein